MQVILDNCGRRFNQEWIFRNLSYTFEAQGQYALLGPNGSGKSTLMAILMGALTTSEGKIAHEEGKVLDPDDVYNHISFAAPYLDLIEEFTLSELIRFHFSFKPLGTVNEEEVQHILQLGKSAGKPIKYFSSGMKQRTKLALAFCSSTPALLLDEPTSNLDAQGVHWYHSLVTQYTQNRLVIVASNQPHEYEFCTKTIDILDYKPAP